MKYCVYCGKEMPDDGKYCSKCGKEQHVLDVDVSKTLNQSENDKVIIQKTVNDYVSQEPNQNIDNVSNRKNKIKYSMRLSYFILCTGIIFVGVSLIYLLISKSLGNALVAKNRSEIQLYYEYIDKMLPWLRIQLVFMLLFLYWVYKSYKKLPLISGEKNRWSTGWAIGGWLIPILNLWRPYQVMSELWNKSNPDKTKGNNGFFSGGKVGTWWFATIAGVIYGRIAEKTLSEVLSNPKASNEAIQKAFSNDFYSSMFIIGAAIWTIYLVMKISFWQKDSLDSLP